MSERTGVQDAVSMATLVLSVAAAGATYTRLAGRNGNCRPAAAASEWPRDDLFLVNSLAVADATGSRPPQRGPGVARQLLWTISSYLSERSLRESPSNCFTAPGSADGARLHSARLTYRTYRITSDASR